MHQVFSFIDFCLTQNSVTFNRLPRRCILTNIDPTTSKRSPSFQPLKTLTSYRKIVPNDSPVLGVHLGVRSMGAVSIGDAVYVEDTACCCF